MIIILHFFRGEWLRKTAVRHQARLKGGGDVCADVWRAWDVVNAGHIFGQSGFFFVGHKLTVFHALFEIVDIIILFE